MRGQPSADLLFLSIRPWVLGEPLESQLADRCLNQAQLVFKAAELVE